MVDYELLTLAARAAGITLTWPDGENDHPRVTDKDGAVWIWNPVDFDGDCLRLMVDLSLKPDYSGIDCDVSDLLRISPSLAKLERQAAVRLAFTRAAAEIGKTIS
jgi:hypothetical protein